VKKFVMLGTVVALVVATLALPALAQDRFSKNDQERYEKRWDRWEQRAEKRGYSEEELYGYLYGRFAHFYGFGDHRDQWNDNDRDHRNDRDDAAAVSQSFEQEAQSGDVSQSFKVTNTGDNSNQCANIQGVAQTGNAQNQIDLLPVFSVADDYEFDEVGSSIDESPTNTATCDQQVNQAASASG
jgi:hypothetical protein